MIQILWKDACDARLENLGKFLFFLKNIYFFIYKFSNINMRVLTVIEKLLVEFINLLMISSLMKVSI